MVNKVSVKKWLVENNEAQLEWSKNYLSKRNQLKDFNIYTKHKYNNILKNLERILKEPNGDIFIKKMKSRYSQFKYTKNKHRSTIVISNAANNALDKLVGEHKELSANTLIEKLLIGEFEELKKVKAEIRAENLKIKAKKVEIQAEESRTKSMNALTEHHDIYIDQLNITKNELSNKLKEVKTLKELIKETNQSLVRYKFVFNKLNLTDKFEITAEDEKTIKENAAKLNKIIGS